MQDVQVRIVCWGIDKLHRSVVAKEARLSTGPKGEYSIELPHGGCDVFFSHSLFEPVAKRVRIEAEKNIVLNVTMKFGRHIKFIE